MASLTESARDDLYKHPVINQIKRVFLVPQRYLMNIRHFSDSPTIYASVEITTMGGDRCTDFKIDMKNDYLYVTNIDTCTMSGNEILATLERLARRLDLTYIVIGVDGSELVMHQCNRGGKRLSCDLAILNILSSGQSWYNRHGYKQTGRSPGVTVNINNTELYERESAINAAIIAEPIQSFLKTRDLINFGIEDVLTPESEDSVQDYFSKIKENMRRGIYNCEQLEIISLLISTIFKNNIIQYDFHKLVKRVDYSPQTAVSRELIGKSFTISLASPNKMALTTRRTKSLSPRQLQRIPPTRSEISTWRLGGTRRRNLTRRTTRRTTRRK